MDCNTSRSDMFRAPHFLFSHSSLFLIAFLAYLELCLKPTQLEIEPNFVLSLMCDECCFLGFGGAYPRGNGIHAKYCVPTRLHRSFFRRILLTQQIVDSQSITKNRPHIIQDGYESTNWFVRGHVP